MLLKNNGIADLDSWFKIAPPMGGAKQWKDGRSAKELARYMTANYPCVPKEIENTLSFFVGKNAVFDWAAEYVTEFLPFGLGRGEGRNHDAFMFNSDIVVGIEGKADESLGSQLIGDALENASDNKKQRINGMIQMLFGDVPENHKSIRYQLVTASVATLLEATKKNVKKAILMVIVFKKGGCYSEEKIAANNADIQRFLTDIAAKQNGEYFIIPTVYGKENNIELYFKHIEIELN
ncbi:MAG: hypothetical protein IJW29_01890 [Clostridia bacterium]|nr:hypothetical protein [Clostridia bacterium]